MSERPTLHTSKTRERIQRGPVIEAVDLVSSVQDRKKHPTKPVSNTGGVLSNLLQLYNADNGSQGKLAQKGDGDVSDAASTKSFRSNKMKRGWSNRRRSSVGKLDTEKLLASMQDSTSNKQAKLTIAQNVAHLLTCYSFLLKLAKALMMYGAPGHRIESQLSACAASLGIRAQFIHIPAIVIACFGDPETHTSETHFVKANGGLNLTQLHNVHEVFRQVTREELSVVDGSAELSRIIKAAPVYNVWLLIFLGCTGSLMMCMLAFHGSPVDSIVVFFQVLLLKILQTKAVAHSPAFANIFEISVATLISFISRGLSKTGLFCYQSIASASVVNVIPGYVILCGALELASKNMMSGSVKLIYAIIYSLFVGFGLSVGSEFYLMIDTDARRQINADAQEAMTTYIGNFVSNATDAGQIQNWMGYLSIPDEAAANKADQANHQGGVYCARDPNDPWYMQPVSPYFAFLFVPTFAVIMCIGNQARIKSRQFPVMVAIGLAGWGANKVGSLYIFNKSDVVSFLGATVVGLLGNLYSRLFQGTAFTAMAPGVLFLVPSGVGAAGGLVISNGSDDMYVDGLMIGFRIVSVAIGITVGVFFSSFLVYSIASTKHKAGAAVFAF